jgi:hypothetical protein
VEQWKPHQLVALAACLLRPFQQPTVDGDGWIITIEPVISKY